jgi:transcriptional regulator GlxA family with amidase domain
VSDDLRALRLEHAQGLLMSTDIPIKDVATLSGLTDQHYLTRLFRRHLNVTPGEMRRARPAGML